MFLFYFISTKIMDVFNAYLNVACFMSIQVSSLSVLYHSITFFSPGLFLYEYKKVNSILLVSFCFTVFSVYIVNVFILPYTWNFFLSFRENSQQSINIYFEASIMEYVKFYKSIYYTFIYISQIFVVVLIILNKVKNKTKFILRTRKLFYLIFLIVSTLFTPPEVLSQLILAGWCFFFFELLIIFSFLESFYRINIVIII